MLFKSNLKRVSPRAWNSKGYLTDDHSQFPQLYRAGIKFAISKSSSLLFEDIVSAMDFHASKSGFKYTSIDVRTHMLMKDMYPAIPGWHCDDFWRPTNDQPDLLNVERDAPQIHYMIVIGGNSMTEFLTEDIELPEPEALPDKSKPAFFQYDEMIEKIAPETVFVRPGHIYSFGPTAFHRASPATEHGFRTFIRLTKSNHRFPKNEIRYQSNVYLDGRIAW